MHRPVFLKFLLLSEFLASLRLCERQKNINMNAQEKYLFDLQGFLLVENALDAAQLQTLNALVDAQLAPLGDAPTKRFGQLLSWNRLLFDLIDNARLKSHLEEIIGPRFRLDHEYLDVIRPSKDGQAQLSPIGAGLHGGSTPFDAGQYFTFRDGRMFNGLTVVAYNLRDVQPGDGGFACVPGSHKSNYVYPGEWRDLSANETQPFVRAVTGPAGSAVIFTEALTHGALPWRGADERRTLFFKFSPHTSSWSRRYYNADEWAERYGEITDRQRAILEAPSARY